jgi:UTP--glucose-1-phosphate uridylyltransferase
LKIRKAVIAVAGYGTRFLPATKVQPKEMLPIVDKPVVQYLVEEAVNSGIEDIIFVTRPGTQTIADHFDSSRELELHLLDQKKADVADTIRAISQLANFAFVRQGRNLPYGNGSPLLAAKRFLDPGEPFAFMFGDDLVIADKPCLKQLIDLHVMHEASAVIAFQDVPRSETCRYGIAKLKPNSHPPEIETIIEKPKPEAAPSTLAQLGRFVLPYRVVEILEGFVQTGTLGLGGELYLTDAIEQMCREGCRVLAHSIEGEWFTTGDPLRFLIANIEYALRRPDISKGLADYLRALDVSRFSK